MKKRHATTGLPAYISLLNEKINMPILEIKKTCQSCGAEYDYRFPFGSRKEAEEKQKYLLTTPGECFQCRIKRITSQAESVLSEISFPNLKYGTEKQKEYAKSLRAGYAASHLTAVTVVQEYLDRMDETSVKASHVQEFFKETKLQREYTILTSENASVIIHALH